MRTARIGQAVDDQLEARIIDDAAAFDEAAAEDAVVTLVQGLPVAHHVAAIVGFVGHHDDDGVALHGVEPADDGAAEAVRVR